MEIVIVGAILFYIFNNNKTIDKEKFYSDNAKHFDKFKENDYKFLVQAKYGKEEDVDQLFMQRITNAIFTFFIMIAFALDGGRNSGSIIDSQIFLNLVFSLTISYVVFKIPYIKLMTYYQKHINEVEMMLPFYLKTLDILLLDYPPVKALEMSIDNAPEVIKPGIKRLVERISLGDQSIEPYIEFANEYPVKNSMRIMRMLYRIGVEQQNKNKSKINKLTKLSSLLQSEAIESKSKNEIKYMEKNAIIMASYTIITLATVILLAMLVVINL